MLPSVDSLHAEARARVAIRWARAAELDVLCAIDTDAARLYAEHGFAIELADDHPFVLDERARWLRSIELERCFVAVDAEGIVLAFAALDIVDGAPYLDQLAVICAAMRRGIGGCLIQRCAAWAGTRGSSALWLTTYAHLPFNGAYYQRHGFEPVPEQDWGPGIAHHIQQQRLHLPAPERRIAMRLPL